MGDTSLSLVRALFPCTHPLPLSFWAHLGVSQLRSCSPGCVTAPTRWPVPGLPAICPVSRLLPLEPPRPCRACASQGSAGSVSCAKGGSPVPSTRERRRGGERGAPGPGGCGRIRMMSPKPAWALLCSKHCNAARRPLGGHQPRG